MTLTIDKQKDRAYIHTFDKNEHLRGVIGTVNCAFGNIVSSFEPIEETDYSTGSIISDLLERLNGQEESITIFGMPCSIFSYRRILHDWFAGRNALSFTMQDLECIRISNNIQVLPNPIEDKDFAFEYGMSFQVKSMLDILYALLYFYTFEKLKIKRCQHCGRWFATTTLKTDYCTRNSPCSEMMISGKPLLNAKEPCKCKQAVKTIRQRFVTRKNSIRQNFITNHPEKLDEFYNQCADYLARYDEAPTIENIIAFHNYLYSDEMPRQSRPNRKSNSEKRKLLGL